MPEPDGELAMHEDVEYSMEPQMPTAMPRAFTATLAARVGDDAAHSNTRYRLARETPFFFAANEVEAEWSCGYRNIQMLTGSLLCSSCSAKYHELLFDGQGVVPSVQCLMTVIEEAWASGFDETGFLNYCREATAQGRDPLKGDRILCDGVWIGATEALTLLRLFGIRAFLTDFQGGANVATRLMQWVWRYFEPPSLGSEWRPPPLYLQSQGHSRTIVGCEAGVGGEGLAVIKALLVWDPAQRGADMEKALSTAEGWKALLRLPAEAMIEAEYQVVWVDECEGCEVVALSAEEQAVLQVHVLPLAPCHTLTPPEVPSHELGQHRRGSRGICTC